MNDTSRLSGEERLRARRRVVFAAAVIMSLAGFAIGFVTGFIGPESLPAWMAIVISIALVIVVLGGSWIYFRNTDELELQDNLFSAAGGLSVYVLGYPIWTLLAMTTVVPPVDHNLLFIGVMTVAGLVYLARKIIHA
jgi:peptidoglycan/LPS O-acetylase OafA/YrhL